MYLLLRVSTIIYFLFLSEGICNGSQSTKSVEEANEYIDRLLDDTIEENRHKLEPYRPDNMTFGFEQKVMFVTFTGKVELHDVTVSGITSVHRNGDCIRSSSGGVRKISVSLGMGVLHLDSKARVSFMDYGPTVYLSNKVGYVLIHLEVSRDDNAGTPPSIDEFRIYETKGEEVKISGLGPLNYIANTMASVSLKFLKGFLKSYIEGKLKVAFDDMIKTSNFPLID